MIRILIFLMLFLTLFNVVVYSQPTESDRQTALSLMYTVTNSQDDFANEVASYEQIFEKWVDGFIPTVDVYDSPLGLGYIVTVSKIENGKVWIIQRHFGPENRDIAGQWTCINCAEGDE